MKIAFVGTGVMGKSMAGHLLKAGHEVVGFDSDLYRRCTFEAGGVIAKVPSIDKDVRDAEPADFKVADAVIHLAALSNDPLGNLDPETTVGIMRLLDRINRTGTTVCGPNNIANSVGPNGTLPGFSIGTGNFYVRPADATNTTALGRYQFLNPALGCVVGTPYNLTATDLANNPTAPGTVCQVDTQNLYGNVTPDIERFGGSAKFTAKVGDNIVINGTNFISVTDVTFNGTSALTWTVNSSTKITAVVPSGATTGAVEVTNTGGTSSSGISLTVVEAPVITSFTPVSGAVGTSVTITGTDFTGATSVKVGANAAVFTVDSDTTAKPMAVSPKMIA